MTTDTPPRGVPLPPPEHLGTTPNGAGRTPPGPRTARADGRTHYPPTRRRTAFTRPDEPEDWRDSGACTTGDEHPDTWFSPLPADRHRAMVTCLTNCPVRWQCLEWAHRTDQRFGIWGGIDFELGRGERAEGKDPAARVPLLERVAAVELSYPGATMAIVAEQLGYKDAASLERTLYRKGEEGKATIRRLKPGSRSMDEVRTKSVPTSGRGLAVDRDHPWLTTAALPVNRQRTNVQHRKTGKPGRRKNTPTGKDTAA